MIRQATLQVLAEAAEIGLPEAATLPASSYDPFLRPMIKKRVRLAVEEAAAKARQTARGDHVLRLAFLLAASDRNAVTDPNDDHAVEQAFYTQAAPFLPPRPVAGYRAAPVDSFAAAIDRPKKKGRFWPVTTPLIVVFLLGGLGVAALFLVPLWLPTPLEKFRKTPLGVAMGEPTTNLVVKGSHLDADTKDKLLSASVQKQIGPDAFKDLERIVQLTPSVGTSDAKTTDEAMAPLFAVVNGFNEHVRQKGIPAMFHAYGQGQALGRNVWLTSFFVDRREQMKLGTIDVKMAWGRRLDHLNLLDSEIYKANGEDWAILSLVLLETGFVESLLTPIAKDQAMGPTEYRDTDTSPEAQVARVAGKVIGAEVLAQTKISRERALDLQVAIAQRNEIVVSLNHAGYGIKPSGAIEVSPATVIAMTKEAEKNAQDKNLLSDFLRLNDRAASMRRHVQPVVVALGQIEEEEFVARIDAEKRYEKTEREELADIVTRSRGIAASELALLARRQTLPKLALWRAAKAAEADHGAYVAMKMMFQHLGLMTLGEEDPYLVKYNSSLRAVYELPAEKVQSAAEATYAKLFGEAPQAFERTLLQ